MELEGLFSDKLNVSLASSVVIRTGNSSCYCPAVTGEHRNVMQEQIRWKD